MNSGISAIVVVYNQADLLKKCLASLSWTDEIIVLDLESTDDIKTIARKYKAVYHKLPYVPVVEEVRQKSLGYAHHDYVILVDADETIPPSLAKAIRHTLEVSHPAYLKIPRCNIVFGKWIRNAKWWPDYQYRVLEKTKVTWPDKLHAQPNVEGEGIELEPVEGNAILHENYQSVDQWLEKNIRYAKKEAQEMIDSGRTFSLLSLIKISVGQITTRFFEANGYKDGMHGLMLSLLQSYYYLLVYVYYWEAKKYAELEDPKTVYHFPHNWFRHGFAETLFWDKEDLTPVNKLKQKLVRKMIT